MLCFTFRCFQRFMPQIVAHEHSWNWGSVYNAQDRCLTLAFKPHSLGTWGFCFPHWRMVIQKFCLHLLCTRTDLPSVELRFWSPLVLIPMERSHNPAEKTLRTSLACLSATWKARHAAWLKGLLISPALKMVSWDWCWWGKRPGRSLTSLLLGRQGMWIAWAQRKRNIKLWVLKNTCASE